MPLNTDKLNSNTSGKGFTPNAANEAKQDDRTTIPQNPVQTIDSASLALATNPISAVNVTTQALADRMVDAATAQAQEITQMVLSYPNLVTQLVQQNLQQAQ